MVLDILVKTVRKRRIQLLDRNITVSQLVRDTPAIAPVRGTVLTVCDRNIPS